MRRWKEADRIPFFELCSDPIVMKFFPSLLSRAECDRLVQSFELHFETNGYGLWALEEKNTGEFLGFTGLKNVPFEAEFTPAVEVAWRLAASYWSRGYATEAAFASLAFGFSDLNLSEIVSFTSVLNLNSVAVMKRIGMRESGFFAHPNLEANHVLSRHVLYRISVEEFRRTRVAGSSYSRF
ncbi:GNAT family N-acetyltransferase [Leptospira gomenensis]|nr:GNAT family N-acetyltransferase [Leptospira gomenensis]